MLTVVVVGVTDAVVARRQLRVVVVSAHALRSSFRFFGRVPAEERVQPVLGHRVAVYQVQQISLQCISAATLPTNPTSPAML